MSVLSNKDATIYLAQERLAEWAGIIVTASVRKSRIYQIKSERLRAYLKAIQYEFFLEEKEIIHILQCMNKISEITDWPTAPVLTEKEQPNVLLGIPGQDGEPGADGQDGSDANIDVEADPAYDNIAITEVLVNGVKTYRIGYAPLTPPTVSVAISSGAFQNANSLVQELGEIIDPVPVVVTTNKGRDNVVSSTFVNPAGLDSGYQAQWDLSSINLGNTEVVTINDLAVTANTTYTVNITDGNSTPSSSSTLSFVDPFFWGSSATLLGQTTYYNNLNKIIQTKGTKTVTFNNTDAYFYFVYPASYGDLTSILDGNGFEAISAFTKTTENVDILSGTVSMNVYRTAITDIVNQKYTFKF